MNPSAVTMSRRPRRRAIQLASASAVVAALVVAGAGPALADETFHIAWTGIGIYPRSGPSMNSSRVGSALSDGASVSVNCEQDGQELTSAAGTSTIWERLSNGTWLPNVYVETHVDGWTPGIPRCQQPAPPVPRPAPTPFDREAAVAFANLHWDATERFRNADCTWFVSQALWAGRLPRTDLWTDDNQIPAERSGPYPGPSRSAVNADRFKNAVIRAGYATIRELSWSDLSAGHAQPGDVIGYDWNNGADGILDHLAIVTRTAPSGAPLVTQHTPAQQGRLWSWSRGADDWIQKAKPGSRVYLIHITR